MFGYLVMAVRVCAFEGNQNVVFQITGAHEDLLAIGRYMRFSFFGLKEIPPEPLRMSKR